MNAPLLRADLAFAIDWAAMRAEVDLWCGQCVGQFTRAEAHVAEALLLLSREGKAGHVRLDHLAGHRSVELERLLAGRTDGPATRAVKALQAFRHHERLRTFLCHGSATVLAEEAGDWHLLLRVLEFRKDEPKRDVLYLARAEMAQLLEVLRRDGQRLGSHLTNLHASPIRSA